MSEPGPKGEEPRDPWETGGAAGAGPLWFFIPVTLCLWMAMMEGAGGLLDQSSRAYGIVATVMFVVTFGLATVITRFLWQKIIPWRAIKGGWTGIGTIRGEVAARVEEFLLRLGVPRYLCAFIGWWVNRALFLAVIIVLLVGCLLIVALFK